jgi:hypothetical protein
VRYGCSMRKYRLIPDRPRLRQSLASFPLAGVMKLLALGALALLVAMAVQARYHSKASHEGQAGRSITTY